MKFKKQIIIAISCLVVLCGIFFAISYIGDRDQAVKEPNNNTVKNDETNNKEEASSELKETEVNSALKEDEANSKIKQNDKDSSTATVKEGYYIVKKNDTLYSIARTYMPNSESNKVIETILKRNDMAKDAIIAEGQKLIISYETALESGEKAEAKSEEKSESVAVNTAGHNNHSEYVVKSGDTLYSIAKEHLSNMDTVKGVEELKSHNNIKDVNTIKVEDKICIPTK